MKKEKSIQADIEVLREIRSFVSLETPTETMGVRFLKALTVAKEALEAMRDAEMPEKKDIDNYNAEEIGGKSWQRAIAFNEAISLCQPIVSKLLLRIKELRELNQ